MRSVFAVVTAALLLSCAPAAATPGGGWSARAEDLFERSGAPGMVAVVVHGDRIVWAAGFGRDGHSEPMTARSPVQIASLSKSFTAVVVARLARAEGIDLDQPVAGGRPDLTVADTRHRAIRLRHLLTHTSGLTDAGVHYWRTVDDGAASLDDHVRALPDERLSAAPGTTFRYASIDYVLLGAGAEQVSGQPFSALLRETVLTPAGLAQTTPDAAPEPRGFNSLFGWWVPRTDTSEVMRGNPAGGPSSTAKDLGRWMTIVNGHGPQALDPATRRILESPPPASEGYAGWQTDEYLPGWWGHAGNRCTHSGHVMRNPTTGWGVAVVVDGATMTDPAYRQRSGGRDRRETGPRHPRRRGIRSLGGGRASRRPRPQRHPRAAFAGVGSTRPRPAAASDPRPGGPVHRDARGGAHAVVGRPVDGWDRPDVVDDDLLLTDAPAHRARVRSRGDGRARGPRPGRAPSS